jgi:DNA-3-methyladenine glycosylase II
LVEVCFAVDGEGLRHLKDVDPILGGLIDQVSPIELELREDRFTALARAIAGQQLSVTAAQTIWNRLATLVGTVDAETVASTDHEALRGVGLSGAKATYLVDLALRVREGTVDLAGLDRLADEEVIRELITIRGVGRWTAEMFLIFSLGRMDVFAKDDVGLQRAVARLYGPESIDADRANVAAKWRPFRTVASLCLWKALDQGVL